MCSGGSQQHIAGQADHFAHDAHVGDDLGKADAVESGSGSGPVVVDGVDADGHIARTALQRNELASGRSRLGSEVDAARAGVVGDGDPCDPAVAVVERLRQRDLVDRSIGGEAEKLADWLAMVAGDPSSVGIAVDSHGRSIFGTIRERLAVRAGRGMDGTSLLGNSHVATGLVGEHGDALVSAVEREHPRVCRSIFGETRDVLRAAPVMGALAVAIGDDDSVC